MNRLNDADYQIDLSSDEYKYMCRVLDTYVCNLKLYNLDYSKPLKDRYTGLLYLMSKIRKNFDVTFKKTVDSIPGFRMYLLTHTVFEIGDNRSYDWFLQFMIDYLVPNDEEVEEFTYDVAVPDEILKVFSTTKHDFISDFDDGVIIKFGMWRKDKNDKICQPVDVIETDLMDSLIVDQKMVKKIIDSIKIIDLSVIGSHNVE